MPNSIFVVIPTIRDVSFLTAWENEFSGCHLVIVEDHETKEILIPKVKAKTVSHYSWQDIERDFGRDSWIFPRKNAGIRSYGFWRGYQMGADIIITLDDDCYPVGDNFVKTHAESLSLKAPQDWFSTYPHPEFVFTRGFPYRIRDRLPVVISHGLWAGAIDLDAHVALKNPRRKIPFYPPIRQFVPKDHFFPMSSMNLAFRRNVVPLMYFPLMGQDPEGKPWGFDRFEDIWAGIFAKKVCDHLGLAVVNGSPFVEHRQDGDYHLRVKKEASGLRMNEKLWQMAKAINLTKTSPKTAYQELILKLKLPKGRYFTKLKEATKIWAELF